MASSIKKYVIGRNRLQRGRMDGFRLTPRGRLEALPDVPRRTLFLGRIDSNQDGCTWGRLAFDGAVEGDGVLIVHAFASNEDRFIRSGEVGSVDAFLLDPAEPLARKEKLFSMAGASRFVSAQDVLLYEQTGRYLWIWLELLGSGGAWFENFRLFVPGDNFYQTFPEVYRTNGEFFHRYLSIFSSMYADLQETIDGLWRYVDPDTAPAQALPVFARWLGLELDGNFLDESHLRLLIKNAFPLIQAKGTRAAVEGIVRLFVKDPVYIVERALVSAGATDGERAVYKRLYGESDRAFTVLINRTPDERLRARLLFLIGQFKPVRSQARVVFLGEGGSMDAFCYLDLNARTLRAGSGAMDENAALTGLVALE